MAGLRLFVSVAVVWCWLSQAVQAGEVTIHTRSGGNITGELIEYLENKQTVVQLGAGRKVNVAANDVDTLTIGSGRPEVCQLRATALLKQGGTLVGKLVEYMSHRYVRISIGVGEPMRVEAADLESMTFEGGTGPGCVAASPKTSRSRSSSAASQKAAENSSLDEAAQDADARSKRLSLTLDPASRAAAIQSLMVERADWVARDTGIVVPLLFTLGGAIIAGAGAGLLVAAGHNDAPYPPGVATLAVGGAALATGLVFWSIRTSDRRQRNELQRIDGQLRALGVQASLVPWVVPRGRMRADVSAGLSLILPL